MTLGFGILSWRGYDSLTAALETYRQASLLDLFDKTLLFLPQAEPRGFEIAACFGIEAQGTADNLGILGGFEEMARRLDCETLVLAENDYMLIEPRAEAIRQLGVARRAVESGEAQVWRLRHREHPGQVWAIDKAEAFWPRPSASAGERLAAAVRRALRPEKARRLSGWSVFLRDDAETLFPQDIARAAEGDWLVSSRVLPWANNIFMIRRDFFLETIIPAAKAAAAGRLINGFPTIETELNRGWWRARDFRIGVGRGLFTHERQGDRGY